MPSSVSINGELLDCITSFSNDIEVTEITTNFIEKINEKSDGKYDITSLFGWSINSDTNDDHKTDYQICNYKMWLSDTNDKRYYYNNIVEMSLMNGFFINEPRYIFKLKTVKKSGVKKTTPKKKVAKKTVKLKKKTTKKS